MPQFVPVNRGRHSGKAWRALSNYSFASQDAIVPLVAAEFAKAAVTMPIAFMEWGGRVAPMAIMSPQAQRNLFVGPAGQWLAGYVPAAFRAYPFRLAPLEGSDEKVLCVDETSGLVFDLAGDASGGAELSVDQSGYANTVADPGRGGLLQVDAGVQQSAPNAFFEPDGQLSPMTKAAFDFLITIEQNRVATDNAVQALVDVGLVQPWPFQLRVDGRDIQLDSLYRVDEAALNALDDESFLHLRRTGALLLAYMQLLSMGQVANLERLAHIQQQLAAQIQQQSQLPVFADDETVRFK